jgi:ribose/xylose/arabinose/galactoside ABC-type transport system permease subunit
LGLALVFVAGCVVSRTFLTVDNQRDALRAVSSMGVVAVGMTFVILTGGIDLSVGRMLGLCSTIAAMLLMDRQGSFASALGLAGLALGGVLVGLAVWAASGSVFAGRLVRGVAAVAIGVAAGALAVAWGADQISTGFRLPGVLIAVPLVGMMLGTVSGVTAAKGRMQPFIATLAMMIFCFGLARIVAGKGGAVHSLGYGTEAADPAFELLRQRLPLGFGRWRIDEMIPVPGIVFALTALIGHLVLSSHSAGRLVYAVGGNEEAARLSGIRVDRVKIAVYAVSGLLAALAGVMDCAQYRQGKPDAGAGLELDAIAAVVIGGTSLMGGRGSVAGTVIGVLIFAYLNNILMLVGLPTDIQLVVKGLVIVLAVLAQEGQIARWTRGLGKMVRN